MTRTEFEEKYLKHNFFCIKNKSQADQIQKIFFEFGYLTCIGDKEPLKYTENLVNLVTFQSDKWHNYKFFQRVDIYNPNYSYGKAVDYEAFLKDYNSL